MKNLSNKTKSSMKNSWKIALVVYHLPRIREAIRVNFRTIKSQGRKKVKRI